MLNQRIRNTVTVSKAGPNYLLIINILILILIGILMVYEASIVYATQRFGNRYHFLFLQSAWMIAGLSVGYVISRLNLEFIKKYAFYLWIINILFLVFVLLPTPFSPEVYGAKRWIYLNPDGLLPVIPFLGRLSFQPSELVKFTSLLYCSTFLTSAKVTSINEFKFLLKYLGIVGVTVGLVFLQPNFSTAMIIGSILISLYFFAGGRLYYFLVGLPAIIGLASAYVFSSEYRRIRIMTLFEPDSIDKSSTGYHINQIMIALGSGGLFGLGLGKSRQKYAYLPEVTADSLFAVIGEELGFIGATFVVLLLVGLIWQCFDLAAKGTTRFNILICCGVGTWLAVQTLINLGAIVRVIPLTGIPLPLISYGGSSAIFLLMALGLVVNISRENNTSDPNVSKRVASGSSVK